MVPTRNPEGDSVIKYLNLDITCNAVEEVDLASIGVGKAMMHFGKILHITHDLNATELTKSG